MAVLSDTNLAANVSTVGDVVYASFYSNGDTFYKGGICYIDTAGGVQALPASGDIAIGVTTSRQVATTAGDEVEVMVQGLVWLPVGTNVTAADEGTWICCNLDGTLSDNPADLESSGDLTLATKDIAIGKIMRVTSTRMLIQIGPGVTGLLYATSAGAFVPYAT